MSIQNRIVRVVGAIAVTLFVITGCAISSNNSGPSGQTTTLTFWSYFNGTQEKWLQDQVAKFNKANPGIVVNIVKTVGAQQDQKLLASVATKSTPDLFINNIVVDYPTLQKGGVLKDLTSYWNGYQDRAKFPASAVWRTNSHVYNLMSYTNLIGLWVNTDITSQYGITEVPATLDELQADLAKVTAGGKYQGIALSGAPNVQGAWLFAPELLSQGIGYCNFVGPKVNAAFERVQAWAKAGYTPAATATWSQTDSWQQFSTGKYAFGINGNWQLGNAKSLSFKYTTGRFPAAPGGKSIVYPGGEGFGIGANSKHADLAWKFLEQAILSKDGGQKVYEEAGSIPVRSDVADTPALKNDALVKPFVEAAQSSAAWPNNPNTAQVQAALGQAVSGVISGQSSADDAAQAAENGIKSALQAGGGGCK